MDQYHDNDIASLTGVNIEMCIISTWRLFIDYRCTWQCGVCCRTSTCKIGQLFIQGRTTCSKIKWSKTVTDRYVILIDIYTVVFLEIIANKRHKKPECSHISLPSVTTTNVKNVLNYLTRRRTFFSTPSQTAPFVVCLIMNDLWNKTHNTMKWSN